MSAITKEWLQHAINDYESVRDGPFDLDDYQGKILVALRIALASLEAEAVAYIIQDKADRKEGNRGQLSFKSVEQYHEKDINEHELTATPLYTARPAPVSVPDEMEPTVEAIKRILPTSNPDEYAVCIGADMWNACRAAMLQGAEHVSNRDELPDGWVACSERMPEGGSKVIFFRPRADESNDPPVKTATYKGGREYYHGFDCYCEPTHWMPLPPPPLK
ncbi:DUF551 domain-containing protein [Enterobacter asburiae]|nr:DUF551 domain-containing protein [Enterobacter asburiae]